MLSPLGGPPHYTPSPTHPPSSTHLRVTPKVHDTSSKQVELSCTLSTTRKWVLDGVGAGARMGGGGEEHLCGVGTQGRGLCGFCVLV